VAKASRRARAPAAAASALLGRSGGRGRRRDGAQFGRSRALPRDLGPFAPVDEAQGDEFLSAVAFDGDFITSAIGNWNGTRSPSLIRRQTADGTTKWEVKDGEIGAGPTAAAQEIVLCRRVSVPSERQPCEERAVLRALSLTGGPVVPARLRMAQTAHSSWVWRRRRINQPSRRRPTGRREVGRGLRFGARRQERNGSRQSAARHRRRHASGPVGPSRVNKDGGLAVISRSAHLTQRTKGFDWMGRPEFVGKATRPRFSSSDCPASRRKDDLASIGSAPTARLRSGDGWVLVGEARDDWPPGHARRRLQGERRRIGRGALA